MARNSGFEATLFLAADKLRGNMEPSDYKHVALGLIFLKYISDAFEAKRAALLAEDLADAEDPDEYLADNVFWVPKEARWSHLQANAKQPTIGKLIDDAMIAIEQGNASLKGVLPKDYARPALNKVMLGELIDLISGIAHGRGKDDGASDLLGRVYEYFLGGFAGAEGKRGGEFYTPRSVVRVLVEMLEPYKGRVYDPCCGSGGMFVQSEKFVEAHGGRIGDIAIYGQESNYTTWRLCKMNLAVRGIDADIRWNNEGSFHKDELQDLRADFILANPPFNISDWGGERLREDARWKYRHAAGRQRQLRLAAAHPAPPGAQRHGGRGAGQWLHVLGAKSGEGEIRRAMIEADVVDCMIALPGQLFYSTQIPACLWFLAQDNERHRRQRKLARPARRGAVHRRPQAGLHGGPHPQGVFRRRHRARSPRPTTPGAASRRGRLRGRAGLLQVGEPRGNPVAQPRPDAGPLCRAAEAAEEDDVPFAERFAALQEKLEEQFAEAEELSGRHPGASWRRLACNG